MKWTLLKFYNRATQSFIDKTEPGILLNRFSQDMTLVETPLSIGALFTVYSEHVPFFLFLFSAWLLLMLIRNEMASWLFRRLVLLPQGRTISQSPFPFSSRWSTRYKGSTFELRANYKSSTWKQGAHSTPTSLRQLTGLQLCVHMGEPLTMKWPISGTSIILSALTTYSTASKDGSIWFLTSSLRQWQSHCTRD